VSRAFSVSVTPPLTIQIAPLPGQAGLLDLVTVNTGATLDPSTGVVMGLPDDLCWAVKWGALADLLSQEGTAKDPLRAAYCEKRWQEGIQLALMATSVMQVQVNGTPIKTHSLWDMDTYLRNWQNVSGVPRESAMAGNNMMAFYQVPDSTYTITLDIVTKAPIPVNDGDYLQIGREELDVIYAEAQHTASFNLGGKEFQDSMGLHDRFVNLAKVKNERIRANALFATALTDRENLEEQQRPRRNPPQYGIQA
jgi:hypothetical protein